MIRFPTLPAAVLACAALFVQADARADWVASWYASPQARWGGDFILPVNVPERLRRQTVREVVRLSAGGQRLRLVLSNRYGGQPLVVGEMRVALAAPDGSIVPGRARAVTFGGKAGAIAAPGAPLISDPVELPAAPLAQLAVTTYFPESTPVSTFHWGGQQSAAIAPGNATAAASMPQAASFKGRVFLSAVLVDAPPGTRSVVAFGDSITDGNGSTPDADRRWPDFLARRLAPSGVAVVNAGISGARLLGDRMGVNALARFEQDVLGQPGVASVIVLMGINDIGWPGSPFAPRDAAVTAQDVIGAYRQLIASAHARKVRIVGATLTPFEHALQGTPYAGHYSVAKEAVRQQVNHWIRTSGEFDAVADFDALLRDPRRPSRMLAAYDSGDHLHPGDAGYEAMADAIDLDALRGAAVDR